MDETKKFAETESARSKVPMNARLGLGGNMVTMAGWVIVISSMMVGGGIGIAFPPKLAIPIILFACLSNCFVAVLVGSIGARTGYSTGLVFRFAYGEKGTLLTNLAMAFSAMGWFSVIINSTRDAVAQQFGVQAGTVTFYVILVAISILFVAPAFKSIKWIKYVNYICVPALLAAILYVSISVINGHGGIKEVMAISTTPTMTVLMGYSTAAGGWLQGATVSSDLSRYCKSGKQSIWVMLFSFGVMVFLQFAGAAIGAACTGEYNIFLMLTAVGAGFLAFLAVFLGSWSTGQSIMYGASLQTSAPPMPMFKSEERTRKIWVVILWAIALVGSQIGLESIVNWWNSFLACLVAPVAITVILDYYAFPERQAMYESGAAPDMKVNPAAVLAWLVSFIIGLVCNKYQFFCPVLVSMAVAAVIYYVWMRMALNKKKNPEQMLLGK